MWWSSFASYTDFTRAKVGSEIVVGRSRMVQHVLHIVIVIVIVIDASSQMVGASCSELARTCILNVGKADICA